MSTEIAMSGLRATNQELNVISNNIANSGTTGFRSGRAEFSAIYNGSQLAGVNMSGASQDFSNGGLLNYTGRALDMGIEGSGFFTLRASDGTALYSRAGLFNQDAEGFVVDNYGNKLQGYPVGPAGNIATGQVTDLKIDTDASPARVTTGVQLTSNLNAGSSVPASTPFDASDVSSYNFSNTVTVFDSLGNQHSLSQYYVKAATPNTWQVHYTLDGNSIGGTHDLNFDNQGQFDTDPVTGQPTAASGFQDSLTVSAATLGTGADDMTIDIDWTGTTQFASEYVTSSISQDGYTSGQLTGVRVSEDGRVYGSYTNGVELLHGVVVLTDFANPNGLEPTSSATWRSTTSAGAPLIGIPGSGSMGSLSAGYLEGSNVDLTNELVSLMSAQRNYQANSKVLTAVDNMSQTLMNAI